ncbi:hypothetical protein L195_g063756, partial [Trifolium pratense]
GQIAMEVLKQFRLRRLRYTARRRL